VKGGGRGGERRNGNVIGGRNNEPEGEGRVGVFGGLHFFNLLGKYMYICNFV